MIRYVPVGEALYNKDGPNKDTAFAWYSTSSDRFVDFDGEQVFTNWDDFVEAYIEANGHREGIERYRNLMPKTDEPSEPWKRMFSLYIDNICTATALTNGPVSQKSGSHAHALVTHIDGTVSVDERHVRGLNWKLRERGCR